MRKTVLILGMIIVIMLSLIPVASADAAGYDVENAGYYVYVATPDGGLNMRHGPGTEYDKVMEGRIPDDVKLYIEVVSGNWGYTTYEGNYGWVALKQTTTTPPKAPTPDPVPVPEQIEEPVVEDPADQEPMEISREPENAQPATPVAQPESAPDTSAAKHFMFNQILLIALVIVLVIIIAVLIVVMVNMNNKNKF